MVGEAGDGEEAVVVCRAARPDVVLMDIRMPVLDGVEATRRIAAATDARVLMLTTFDLDEYVYDALQAGASGFLLKDVPPEELAHAVRAVAARRRAARAGDHPAAARAVRRPAVARPCRRGRWSG